MRYFVNVGCIGCGLCAAACPSVFFMTDDNRAAAIDGEIPGDTVPIAVEAKDACPVSAIEKVK